MPQGETLPDKKTNSPKLSQAKVEQQQRLVDLVSGDPELHDDDQRLLQRIYDTSLRLVNDELARIVKARLAGDITDREYFRSNSEVQEIFNLIESVRLGRKHPVWHYAMAAARLGSKNGPDFSQLQQRSAIWALGKVLIEQHGYRQTDVLKKVEECFSFASECAPNRTTLKNILTGETIPYYMSEIQAGYLKTYQDQPNGQSVINCFALHLLPLFSPDKVEAALKE